MHQVAILQNQDVLGVLDHRAGIRCKHVRRDLYQKNKREKVSDEGESTRTDSIAYVALHVEAVTSAGRFQDVDDGRGGTHVLWRRIDVSPAWTKNSA
jgi:hypothetical protein